jgi:hypothetical protein
MKNLIRIFIIYFLLSATQSANAQPAENQKQSALIPDHLIFNYAGNIGNYGIGAGYLLNQKQNLQLGILYGFTPKYKVAVPTHTIAVRGVYLPLTCKLKPGLHLSPLVSLGVSYSTAIGKNTWISQPSVFPAGYYSPTALRFHAGFGGKISYETDKNFFIKKIDLYAETTTNDLYAYYWVIYREVKTTDIFSLMLGLNFWF